MAIERTGKTRFKKLCGPGESWTQKRAQALKDGTWAFPKTKEQGTKEQAAK